MKVDAPVIKSGTVIHVDGHDVIVVGIETNEAFGGRTLYIRATDKDNAEKIQREIFEASQVKEAASDSLNDLVKHVGPMLKKMFDDSEKGYS